MNTPNNQNNPDTTDTAMETPKPATMTLPPPPFPEENAPITDTQGAFTPEWYNRFEDLQPYASTLAKFRRPEALAKSYANLERLKGYPGVEDPRRMAAFRLSVGLPDKAEDYTLSRPEGAPPEIWDERLASSLSQVAYEYGVPAQAMAALSEKYAQESAQYLQASQQAEQAAIEHADAALQEEWGAQYEDNMRTIGDFLLHMGQQTGVDVQNLVENPALRANPDFARLMLATAGLMQEAPLHTGNQGDSREEAHRMVHDPSHPLHEAYMRTNHPQHRYANEQYDRLAFGRRL